MSRGQFSQFPGPALVCAWMVEPTGRLHERPIAVSELAEAEGLAFLNSLRGWCPADLAVRAERA